MTGTSENRFTVRLGRGPVLFDGGMGSMLIAEGLEPGAPPEEWNVSRPDVVAGIHAAYFAAGADVVTTNSFGATPSRLAGFGLGGSLAELNNAAVRLARSAADTSSAKHHERFVAFSVGPTGKMLPPVGQSDEDEIEAEFTAQLACLVEPVDLILGETFFDLREALLMLKASSIVRTTNEVVAAAAVGVSLTFNKTPRGFFTVMGDAAIDSLARVEDAGADFVAINCSIDSGAMVELAETLGSTRRPLLCQPNAGAPAVVDGKPVYAQPPESFADDVARMIEAGASAVGGCCGTDPEFIRLASERLTRS
jgi:methionine synthase I (cobalamin-dependent)